MFFEILANLFDSRLNKINRYFEGNHLNTLKIFFQKCVKYSILDRLERADRFSEMKVN